ncbi:MAG: hypothetical protein PF484_07310 [Bacteroidales bacterium]|jgi:uncharacterized membrane protein YqjE|nr:hypothetical protein [Bacteroidales bacterium]
MEDDELQKIWKSVDSEINEKSRGELNLLLTSKAKQTLKELIILDIIAIPICVGVMVWLIVSSINRPDDKLYLANNILLGIFILIALVYCIWYWTKFQRNKFNLSTKDWLEERINLLSIWLTGRFRKLEFYLFPLIFILTDFSIHVYYTNLYFKEVFISDKFLEEDMWGMIIFTPILLAGGFYGLIKIRKYHMKRLEFLKDLHSRLCNVR